MKKNPAYGDIVVVKRDIKKRGFVENANDSLKFATVWFPDGKHGVTRAFLYESLRIV